MGEDLQGSLAGFFWSKISREVVVRMSAEAGIIWRLDGGRRIYFQVGFGKRLHSFSLHRPLHRPFWASLQFCGWFPPSISEIIQYVSFLDGLFSSSIISLKFLQVYVVCINNLLLFYYWVVFHRVRRATICLTIHPSAGLLSVTLQVNCSLCGEKSFPAFYLPILITGNDKRRKFFVVLLF